MIQIATTATSGIAAIGTIGGMTATEIRAATTSAGMIVTIVIIGVPGVVKRTV